MRAIALVGLLAAVCWIGGGCCLNHAACRGPGPIAAGPIAAGPCIGGACGGCHTCAPPVADCSCGHCAACVGCGGCGGCLHCLFRPLHLVVGLAHRALTCHAGCGNMYWGEWISDPPGPDPCDCDGNWTGHYRGHDPLFSRLHFLWAGHRYHGDCGPGCASCGGDPAFVDQGPMIQEGDIFHEGEHGFYEGEHGFYGGEHEMVPYESSPVILPERRMVPTHSSVPTRSALRHRHR